MGADAPQISAPNGRNDPATGRFVKGNPGGGRPRSIDLRSLVARERGDTIEEKLLAVIDKLCEQGANGDVAAAKLLIERLCGPVKQEVDVSLDDSRLDDATVVRRLHGMLAMAAARVQQERN